MAYLFTMFENASKDASIAPRKVVWRRAVVGLEDEEIGSILRPLLRSSDSRWYTTIISWTAFVTTAQENKDEDATLLNVRHVAGTPMMVLMEKFTCWELNWRRDGPQLGNQFWQFELTDERKVELVNLYNSRQATP